MPTPEVRSQSSSASATLARDETQIVAAVTEAITRINWRLDWLTQQKNAEANVSSENKTENTSENTSETKTRQQLDIVNVAEQLAHPGSSRIQSVKSPVSDTPQRSKSGSQPNLSKFLDTAPVQEIIKDWQAAIRAVTHSAQPLSRAEAINLTNKIAETGERLSAVGLAQAVNQQLVESDTLLKPKEPRSPTTKRRDVIDVSEAATERAAEPQPQPKANKIYRAEELTITKTDNKTTLTDLDGKVLFEYKIDKDGNAWVTTDKVTDNPQLRAAFSKAAAALKETPLAQIRKDPSRRTQVEKLGGLAPRGSHAIAVASYVATDKRPVVRTDQYTFKKLGVGYEVSRNDPALPPGKQLVAVVGNDGQITASQQTSADLAYMKANYKEIRAQEMSHQKAIKANEQARAQGKPISRKDKQAEGRGR